MNEVTALPFNRPYLTGGEAANIAAACQRGHLSGDGHFTELCSRWLEQQTGARRALLTHSCTAALEMAALLSGVGPGDEVIMPSYTFVSTANAFVLRGATPVFVDIRSDTLNLDERLVESAITPKTRAIVPVHYAGVACEMEALCAIAVTHGLMVIEDAAQAIFSRYKNRPLGTIGDLGALSFHETKNITSGEGGALLMRDQELSDRAEILREKGTNRSRFFRGQVDKYTWVDLGSSYLPSELIAAFLAAQIVDAEGINLRRLALWNRYHESFAPMEAAGRLRRPVIPAHCTHNAHMYYLLLRNLDDRTRFIARMKQRGIHCVFHYLPLHLSPQGLRSSRAEGALRVTTDVADRLVRLPLWLGLEPHISRIVEEAIAALDAC
jgi:dTDP-4-amino-4,6-dideoxygalactose transaminase